MKRLNILQNGGMSQSVYSRFFTIHSFIEICLFIVTIFSGIYYAV